jgi:hypothetical protein
MEKINNSTEITKLQKRVNILLWIFVILVFFTLAINWFALLNAMKLKQNFKHEKTKTYNSMHGLPEIKNP